MHSNNKLKTLPISTLPLTNRKNNKSKNNNYSNRLNTIVTQKLNKGYRYDKMLFHKTNFHLRPDTNNPELFTKDATFSANTLKTLKLSPMTHSKARIPHPINVKQGLERIHGKQKMLLDQNLSHLTAKKWIIYSMDSHYVVKGYKYRTSHDIASLSKLLTFYTAYDIVKQYFLVLTTFEILVLPIDNKVGGSMLRVNYNQENIISLQDALYSLMMVSANNIAMAIANNLGNYLIKQQKRQYFNCFDLENQSRDANISAFMQRMRKLVKELELDECVVSNPHGIIGNTASALDVAKIAAQCFKIPLLSKIASMIKTTIKTKDIDEEGEVKTRVIVIENSNKLLGEGCLGGKTGSNIGGGQSFMGVFPGGMAIVVLGCAGKEQRFHDCMRLAEWITNKIFLSQHKKAQSLTK